MERGEEFQVGLCAIPCAYDGLTARSLDFATSGSSMFGGKGEKQLTPEEQEKQRQLDADYKAATNKIPDEKAPTDPWGSVRPAPTVPAPKKKQQ